MSSSSETFCMRLLAAADVAEAEARIWTFKRTAVARFEAFNAQLEAEYVKLENAAVVAKACHEAMEKFVKDELKEKLLEQKREIKILEYSKLTGSESQDSGNWSTGKLCRIIEENSEMSGPAGHSRRIEIRNPTQTRGALLERGLGQVIESKVLQTRAQNIETNTDGHETEICKNENENENQTRKTEEERDSENFENVLTIDEIRIEVDKRRIAMKMEIQRRKREAENRRMTMKEEISRRKKDVENSRGKRNGENSRRKSEENSERNKQKEENSEGENRGKSNSEIDEENEEEIELMDENQDERKIEERREEKLPEAYKESIAEEEDSKIENQEEIKSQENKEIAECNQDTGKPLRDKSSEKQEDLQESDSQYIYREQQKEKRKRPPRKNDVKSESLSEADQMPRSTLKRLHHFNCHCLRPPETCKRPQNFIAEIYREHLVMPG